MPTIWILLFPFMFSDTMIIIEVLIFLHCLMFQCGRNGVKTSYDCPKRTFEIILIEFKHDGILHKLSGIYWHPNRNISTVLYIFPLLPRLYGLLIGKRSIYSYTCIRSEDHCFIVLSAILLTKTSRRHSQWYHNLLLIPTAIKVSFSM